MKTLGEQRVRIDFNVSSSNDVQKIKEKTAELINLFRRFKTQRWFNVKW